MSLLDSVRGLFSGEERVYEYICDRCGSEFESSKSDMSSVSCPDCKSMKIRAAPR